MQMLSDFTYSNFRSLLTRLASDGRQSFRLKDTIDVRDSEDFFLLRHDVDFSPSAALRMAEIETDAGIKATYFLLFSSPYYNLLSGEWRTFPKRLVQLGHEVGLHYDVAAYDGSGSANLESILDLEADLLSRLSGEQVRSIAMHNPSLSGEDPCRNISSYINAYDRKFMSKIPYCSDSCGAWRNETVKLLEGVLPRRLQILIHPIFWDFEHKSRWAHLELLRGAHDSALNSQIDFVKACWTGHQGVKEHDERVKRESSPPE